MKHLLRACIILLTCCSMSLCAKDKTRHHSSSSSSSDNIQVFDHEIQMQLADGFGFPVENTQFWVKVKVTKDDDKITLELPSINFQTGQISSENPFEGTFVEGGYLYTVDGLLPEHVRPTDGVYRSVIGASNNGMSQAFSFLQPVSSIPTPPSGYIVQVTNYGGIIIQQAGTFENVILPGPQILLPTEITYSHKAQTTLKENRRLSTGATNVTKFPPDLSGPTPYRLSLLDVHINDAFDDVVAYAWADNSNVRDQSQPIMNLAVAIGKVDKHGKLDMKPTKFLTNLPEGFYVWDTAVAINRTNKNNIVVSYGVLQFSTGSNPLLLASFRYRAVSFDGGKTWPAEYNGMSGVPQPTIEFEDNRGVASDKYGNIWYASSDLIYNSGIPSITTTFLVSTDGGESFTTVYTPPPSTELPPYFPDSFYSYTQYCFGGDGEGNYGLWWTATLYTEGEVDLIPVIGFIPINNFGNFGIPVEPIVLTQLSNSVSTPTIAASADGKVWIESAFNVGGSLIAPMSLIFKSPGSIEENYAGPWNMPFINNFWQINGYSGNISTPVNGFLTPAQAIIYDEKRQALYVGVSDKYPNYPNTVQNMRVYFMISRDNGQTWSDPIYISNTDFANRGFLSLALDSVTGNLLFGWYDGRKDKTYHSLEYYGAVLPAKKLDELVKKLPRSNPLYLVPAPS